MEPVSLFRVGRHTGGWVRDFYDRAAVWWGPDPQPKGTHDTRVATVTRLTGPAPKRILDLGAGGGATSAALADAGHSVVAVDLSPMRAAYARELAALPHAGAMTVVEGDFYTLDLGRGYDVVCCWEVFCFGNDADQRSLLRRIARDWLAPDGCVVLEVYNPVRPARDAGTEERLAPLPGVPGSVEMIERCHFDPVSCRWIDEWIPTGEPEAALAQSIRCYSPADLLLLVEGTGLTVDRLELDGEAFDMDTESIHAGGRLLDAWIYLARLVGDPSEPCPPR